MYPEHFAVGPASSFLAGLVSVLSPCILPLLPVILGYSAGNGRMRPFAIVMGLSISFTLMGIMASVFGAVLQPYMEIVRLLIRSMVILFGISMLIDINIFSGLSRYTGKVHVGSTSVLGGLVLGMSLGVVWMPCVGPVLGTILAAVTLKQDMYYGALLLFIYSIGFAVPMLLIAYTANISSARLSRIARYERSIKILSGVLLVIAGLWIL